MIELKQINTSDTELYRYAEELLVASFPLEEYRPLEHWRVLSDKSKMFQNNIILDKNKPVGILTYWDLGKCYFIEHFAIDIQLRNNGYGKQVLDLLEKEIDKPLILEVELPDTEIARRRISFYQRYKFEAWNKDYVQPPYRPDGLAVPMVLMSRGALDQDKDHKEIKTKLYREVYNFSIDSKFDIIE